MREAFTFSSEGRDPTEAFAHYVELYARGTDVLRTPAPFVAEVHGWRFDGLLLFERKLSGMIHARGQRVSQDGFDHIVAHAVLAGDVVGSEVNGFDVARAGDVAFVDTLRGNHTETRGVDLLTVSIARDLAEAAVGDLSGLHGTVLHPPASLMLIDYMRALVRHAPEIDPAASRAYSRAFVEILSAALASDQVAGANVRRQDYLRRDSVERFIAAHLPDRSLSSTLIAQGTGISRSTLYRLFEKRGGIARLIGMRRADAVRRALEAGSSETIAELAERFGFVSENHLSRTFAQANGMPPGAYRAAVRSTPPDDHRTGTRRWRGWMSEVS